MSDLNLDSTEFLKLSRRIRRMTPSRWKIKVIERFGGHVKPAGRPVGKRARCKTRDAAKVRMWMVATGRKRPSKDLARRFAVSNGLIRRLMGGIE